ncbi:MAG: lysozyme inhibitor LprI family protein [Sideroxydans sp.]|nr:lysozyme inhibitor LprI family protein [Sideroxydans sp.]
MKRIKWFVFGLLVLQVTAQAASFDCAKAKAKIEKVICGNAELSKLDEEMNVAYNTALKNVRHADTVRQAQKQWIKDRNACTDETCVEHAYGRRLYVLGSTDANVLTQEENPDCDAGSNMENADCLDGKLTNIQHELKTLVVQMRAKLVYPEEQLIAQDLWSNYVEKECASRESVTGWGAAVQFRTCIIQFTRQRIEDLKTYHFCSENGCPATKE